MVHYDYQSVCNQNMHKKQKGPKKGKKGKKPAISQLYHKMSFGLNNYEFICSSYMSNQYYRKS